MLSQTLLSLIVGSVVKSPSSITRAFHASSNFAFESASNVAYAAMSSSARL